ncbi:MAG: hypothetical protein FWC39_01110 [Bacteroidetes bacterium]|nr:hypothetical protein [Bacteroidota bacterium]
MEATMTKKAPTKKSETQKKSKMMLWREKNPEGLGGRFTSMKMVLK